MQRTLLVLVIEALPEGNSLVAQGVFPFESILSQCSLVWGSRWSVGRAVFLTGGINGPAWLMLEPGHLGPAPLPHSSS